MQRTAESKVALLTCADEEVFARRFSHLSQQYLTDSAVDGRGADASVPSEANTSEVESLEDRATHVLDEARMVLPGIQALFGFQLIVVFSERFASTLTFAEQAIHVGAIVLVAIAIALVMTPAAYHRQLDSGSITTDFISLSSKLITAGMVPLMLAIGLDIYLIGRVVLGSSAGSALVSSTVLSLFAGLWFALPRVARIRR